VRSNRQQHIANATRHAPVGHTLSRHALFISTWARIRAMFYTWMTYDGHSRDLTAVVDSIDS
jgi:hypothetical protein